MTNKTRKEISKKAGWSILGALIGALLFFATTQKASAKKERDYQNAWCAKHGGRVEVRLKDEHGYTRADCITKEHAIEFDFAKKWAEAPFQALQYARMTGKKPGIVIICEKKNDRGKLQRLKDNLEFWNIKIKVWGEGCG